MAISNSNSDSCSCSHDHHHDHAHDHKHDHNPLNLKQRWLLTVLTVGVLLVLLRSFIIGQMLVRVTSYSVGSSYSDAIRICKKILFIDKGNVQAWTSLGYAYMDLSQVDMAIPAFEKVLMLNIGDSGAASFELGQAYYSKGDYVKAIGYFERVRSAGPRAGELLNADILKYRHGTLGFRSLNSMQILLKNLIDCYQKTGQPDKAATIQKDYEYYKNKHNRVLF